MVSRFENKTEIVDGMGAAGCTGWLIGMWLVWPYKAYKKIRKVS